ncbi:hypothetical protein BD410DRAFT_786333 [Rickenella mellea]|uniref:MYND-type domain-containing protein n=1 Tax=Rickenella mellea TaxID=50990 RepID=A0A4Y7QBM6_9AGAM|nr:hypothetical protein BD410DRAFT_786333 [Rickenella mellea]
MATHKFAPQLPAKLLQELNENPVMGEGHCAFIQFEYDELRHTIAMRAGPVDQLVSLTRIPVWETLLHIAANKGDVALAYEMIRLGSDLEATDKLGRTALFHAVQSLVALDLREQEPQLYPTYNNAPQLANAGPRFKMVASLLIEQHADVNVVWNDFTCFTMLMHAKSKHWDIIELLIAHGASEDMCSRNDFVLSTVENEHISELLRTRQSQRPPRPCPCFSGRLLANCHGKGPRPFPYHFVCPCQSGEVYTNCCKKRKIAWREVWNVERGIIEPWRTDRPVDLLLPMHTNILLSKLRNESGKSPPPTEMLRRTKDLPWAVTQIGLPPEIDEWVLVELHLDTLSMVGLVDPGFAFAIKKANWNARPLGRKIPKKYATDIAQVFNKHVDEYIASGRDSRKAMDVEIASKLGPSCGALYRVCEAQGCNKQEGRRIKKLKYCRNCRMAVYCSLKCQHAHWKVHEIVCCAPFQTEQPLPSQRALQGSLTQNVLKICSTLIHHIKDKEPKRFRRLFPEGVPKVYEHQPGFDSEATQIILEKFGFEESKL